MHGRAGKSRNIFLVWLVWPLLTFGIYFFVWYYKINREARDLDDRIEVSPVWAMLAQLLGWMLILPPFISTYRCGERISQMRRAAGLPADCNPWIGVILMFVGAQALYYQNEMNAIWARYDNPPEGADIPLVA
ncbi:DUF4234 domain-containing protein [Streptomyces actinomycinicus]|uniref:DUF4234 domain-containing protein n=1 Tax=Streptomyces actinomycinicus TaxID=1695166 RepID=A0A937ERK2_9ACTN|nr:DUF4234 domain-containing protein [Streptomyces actinomycinicus]MBL1087165.1 DUF4234 domain-containing protein [Streptomyces actinomycinicus]